MACADVHIFGYILAGCWNEYRWRRTRRRSVAGQGHMGIDLAQAQPYTSTKSASGNSGLAQRENGNISRDMLKPLLAGARARGLCDAFDLLGVGAVLFDRAGMALQANACAKALMGPDFAISHRHLVGRDASQTRAFQEMIGQAVSGLATTAAIEIPRTNGEGAYRLEAKAMPECGSDSAQLLKAIVLIHC